MRLTVAALLLAASLGSASAFAPSVPPPSSAQRRTGSILRMASAAAEAETKKKKQTKPLSPAEILAQQREKAGIPDDADEHPKLFDDVVLDDFQEVLLKLEKRVKEGPGSLSAGEVLEFEAATGRILVDMREKLNGGEVAPKKATPPPAATATAAPPAAKSAPPPPPPAAAAKPAKASAPGESEFIETSDEEGEAYDGEGGLGLATDTRNTWVIPGMEEMTAEEYQQALQQSVTERQERRREAMRGVLGNRAGNSYLDTLGYGGASSSLAAQDEEMKGKEQESRPELYDA